MDLDKVYFRLKIEDVFEIKGRDRIVVTGRVSCGEIHDKSEVAICDEVGVVLNRTVILDLDWFDRYRCGEHVTASEGMNTAILFKSDQKPYLQINRYVVIEEPTGSFF